MKKTLLTTFAILFFFFLSQDSKAQFLKGSGEHYCSVKKMNSPVTRAMILGPNSPGHTFDVLKYKIPEQP